jgi:hypothetical protein
MHAQLQFLETRCAILPFLYSESKLLFHAIVVLHCMKLIACNPPAPATFDAHYNFLYDFSC